MKRHLILSCLNELIGLVRLNSYSYSYSLPQHCHTNEYRNDECQHVWHCCGVAAQNPTASHRRYQSAVDLSGFLSDVTLGVSMKPNDSARPKPHHFLTPPLKRKRQRLGSETSTSFTAGCTKSTKSMGIIGILKVGVWNQILPSINLIKTLKLRKYTYSP